MLTKNKIKFALFSALQTLIWTLCWCLYIDYWLQYFLCLFRHPQCAEQVFFFLLCFDGFFFALKWIQFRICRFKLFHFICAASYNIIFFSLSTCYISLLLDLYFVRKIIWWWQLWKTRLKVAPQKLSIEKCVGLILVESTERAKPVRKKNNE